MLVLRPTDRLNLRFGAGSHCPLQVDGDEVVEAKSADGGDLPRLLEYQLVSHVADHRVGPQELLPHPAHQQHLHALQVLLRLHLAHLVLDPRPHEVVLEARDSVGEGSVVRVGGLAVKVEVLGEVGEEEVFAEGEEGDVDLEAEVVVGVGVEAAEEVEVRGVGDEVGSAPPARQHQLVVGVGRHHLHEPLWRLLTCHENEVLDGGGVVGAGEVGEEGLGVVVEGGPEEEEVGGELEVGELGEVGEGREDEGLLITVKVGNGPQLHLALVLLLYAGVDDTAEAPEAVIAGLDKVVEEIDERVSALPLGSHADLRVPAEVDQVGGPAFLDLELYRHELHLLLLTIPPHLRDVLVLLLLPLPLHLHLEPEGELLPPSAALLPLQLPRHRLALLPLQLLEQALLRVLQQQEVVAGELLGELLLVLLLSLVGLAQHPLQPQVLPIPVPEPLQDGVGPPQQFHQPPRVRLNSVHVVLLANVVDLLSGLKGVSARCDLEEDGGLEEEWKANLVSVEEGGSVLPPLGGGEEVESLGEGEAVDVGAGEVVVEEEFHVGECGEPLDEALKEGGVEEEVRGEGEDDEGGVELLELQVDHLLHHELDKLGLVVVD